MACSTCQDGTVPEEQKLTLIGNPTNTDVCGTCQDFAGRYYLQWLGGAGTCWWQLGIDKCSSILSKLTLQIYQSGGDYILEAEFSDEGYVLHVVYRKNLGTTKPDCRFVNETLPLESQTGDLPCYFDYTTMTVSAVLPP